ncbi:peptidoglycan-binding protein [Salipaludibacillus sp. HK11]|uniref:peptidoglycan-binding protein n=1 Tax=Salipaludibacillus sp. HK11 TaxID=3394320 RepID=UPI0039FBEAF5
MKKRVVYSLIVVLLLGVFSPATSLAQTDGESSTERDAEIIKLDPSYQHDPFDGWGTALVWFANVTGGWPDDVREALADELFAEEGLNFNIGRYNIGGGDSPETEPYMRKGGAVPGYWERPDEFAPPEDAGSDWSEEENWWDPENPDHWNWEADADQLWWVEAAMERGADTFEAFSNSPPYFMTQSGVTSGNEDSWDDNIKPDQFENFAKYTTGVVEYLQDHLDMEFQTLSPVNEPNNGYWGAYGRQEGANWSPASQARIINEVKQQLDEKELNTVVSAMDETNPSRFRHNWEQYDQATKDNIGQLNVHTYWPEQHTSIRDIAKGEETRLWMSEVDLGPSGVPQNFEDIRPALALSERIQKDIQELEPKAWVLWQAIEDEVNMNANNENMNWGLIHVDFDPDDFENLEYHKNKKYYAMGNYSKFIRPGYQFINSDNRETLAAMDDDSETLVLVHTNHSSEEKALDFDLSGFSSVNENAVATPHVTSSTENLAEKDGIAISDDRLSVVVEPESVTTFEVTGISGVHTDKAFLSEDAAYKFINKNSGKTMDIAADGESIVQTTDENGLESQQWSVEKVTDGYSNSEYYLVVNQETGKALAVNGWDALLKDKDENDETQKWLPSSFGNGEYTLLNADERVLLEVYGQSQNENASIGLWYPNSGNNQTWQLVPANDTIQVTGVSLDPEVVTLTEGESMQLEVTISPEDATNKDVVWTSSDEEIAMVDEDGNVTAQNIGTAQITVTTVDGEFTASSEVTVAGEATPEVDTEELESLLDTAKAYTNDGEYTEESFATLQSGITEAEETLANQEATQEDIDAAVTDLQAAIDQLETATDPDPEPTLKDGYTGAEVVTLKQNLSELGFGNFPTSPSERFGPVTEAVVLSFQHYFGLESTGMAGEETLSLIDEILHSIYTNGNTASEIRDLKLHLTLLGFGNFPSDPSENYGPVTMGVVSDFQRANQLVVSGIADPVTLALLAEQVDALTLDVPYKDGDTGKEIVTLKENLTTLGFGNFPASPSDIFGPMTEAIVASFQVYFDLEVTREANQETLDLMDEILNSVYTNGKSAAEVKEMKQKLTSLGYGNFPANPSENYGPVTMGVVRDFQRANHLIVSGVADPVTLAKIEELYE